jgi:hypothetical protein
MARYTLLILCSDCVRIHPTKIYLELDDGPTKRESIDKAYKEKPLPHSLAKLLRNAVLCPETGKHLMLDNTQQIYLLPTG